LPVPRGQKEGRSQIKGTGLKIKWTYPICLYLIMGKALRKKRESRPNAEGGEEGI